jgi:UDP-N-acetylmuramoyl-L-alanine---L-glutamate ligase
LVGERWGLVGVCPVPSPPTFPGLPHRLQSVGSATIQDQITLHFYNDSLATTPESSAAAISSFPPNSVHLLAGGHERNLSFQPLAQAILEHQVKTVFLFPPTGTRIEQAIRDQHSSDQALPLFIHVTSMADVFSALHNSKTESNIQLKTNDTVLLSPAAPSFGIFKDYRDRGDQFTENFRKLQ